jgi:hypothetical protein
LSKRNFSSDGTCYSYPTKRLFFRRSDNRPSCANSAQKIAYANEGAEAAKKEAEINQRKRKQEDEATWESRRDERVSTWREFAGTSSSSAAVPKKTKKKKLNVLG